jgi:hypothetical protein
LAKVVLTDKLSLHKQEGYAVAVYFHNSLLLAVHFSPSLSPLTLDPLRIEGRSMHIGSKPRNDEDCCMQTGEETNRMETSPEFIFVDPPKAAGIISGL